MIGLMKPRKSLLHLAYRLVCISQTLVESTQEVASIDFSSPLGISGEFVQISLGVALDKAMIFMNRAQKLRLGPPSSPSRLRLGLVNFRLDSPGDQKVHIPHEFCFPCVEKK